MSTDVAAVGERVRALRERAGMSHYDVAERAGVDRYTVQALERGTSGADVRLGTLAGIAAALDLPVGVLLGESPPPIHWPADGVFWRQVRREIEQILEVA